MRFTWLSTLLFLQHLLIETVFAQNIPTSMDYLATLGTGVSGTGNNQFYLPSDVYVGRNKTTFVVDRGNNRIQVFDETYQYVTTISNQFNTPSGIVQDSQGTIYVADRNNNRIQIFDENYQYRGVLNAATDTSSNYNFDRPSDIEIDNQNNIYIADFGHHRIQIFDSDLNYLSTIGGTQGSENHQLSNPVSLCINKKTNDIIITDYGNHRIQIFDKDHNFISNIGGSDYSNSNQFTYPYGVAVNSDGLIYVSDQKHRVQAFDFNFEHIFTLGTGSQGTSNDRFGYPAGLALDSLNRLYIADYFNHRLQIFSPPAPTFDFETSAGTVTNGNFILTIIFSNEVADFSVQNIESNNATITNMHTEDSVVFNVEVIPIEEGPVTVEVPASTVRDRNGILNKEGGSYSLQFDTTAPEVNISSYEGDSTQLESLSVFVTFSEAVTNFDQNEINIHNATLDSLISPGTYYQETLFSEALSEVTDMAFDQNRNLYVTYPSIHGIILYNEKLEYIETFGEYGTGDGQFNNPKGVFIDKHGKIYVADEGNSRIQIFDEGRNHLATMYTGNLDYNQGQALEPARVAVDSQGNIVILDFKHDRVQIFDKNLQYIATIGEGPYGSEENQFIIPNGIAVDKNDHIYVADYGGNNVQIYDHNYAHSATIDSHSPIDIMFDSLGNLYIVQRNRHQVQVLNQELEAIKVLGTGVRGDRTDQFNFPYAVAFDGRQNIVVLDQYNNRIQTFKTLNGYELLIRREFEGAIDISVNAGVAIDMAGNANVASQTFSIIYAIPPTVEVSSTENSYTNKSFTFEATFSEKVLGFVAEDIEVTNGTTQQLETQDSITFSVQIQPTTEGIVTAHIPPGAASDLQKYTNQEPGYFSIYYDPIKPTIALTTIDSDTTRLDSIPVTIAFNEPIEDFQLSDISVTNGFVTQLERVKPEYIREIKMVDNSGFYPRLLLSPKGIKIHGKNRILIGDMVSRKIIVFDSTFTPVDTIHGPNNNGFINPDDIAVDGFGNVYVAEKNNGVIQVFDKDYNFILTIGKEFIGKQNQTLNPDGVAVDRFGNIYIVDRSNHKVHVLNKNFSYIRSLGSGNQGSTNADFNTPTDITIDPFGRIYIADTYNHRVQVFNQNLEYIHTIGTGETGNTNDQFYGPENIVSDALGNIYIVDAVNKRIQVYDYNSNYITTIGSEGRSAGQFIYPHSVDIDPSGKVYVSDDGRANVQLFETVHSYRTWIVPTSEEKVTVQVLSDQVVDGSGNGNVPSNQIDVVYQTPPTISISSNINFNTNQAQIPVTIAFSEKIVDFSTQTIERKNATLSNLQTLDSISFTVDVLPTEEGAVTIHLPFNSVKDKQGLTNETPVSYGFYYDAKSPIVQIINQIPDSFRRDTILIGVEFDEPVKSFNTDDIAITNGKIITSSIALQPPNLNRTIVEDPDGMYFSSPWGLTVDQDDNLYVVQSSRHRVLVYDKEGNHTHTIGGSKGKGNYQFLDPAGVVVGPYGYVYVVDGANHRIQIFDSTHTYIATIGNGTIGSSKDQFYYPRKIALDKSGNIYIADHGNNRIQIFNNSWQYVSTIGVKKPQDVAIDASGNILVSEQNSNQIQVYNQERKRIASIKPIPIDSSEQTLQYKPSGITVDDLGNIYVTHFNQIVQIFDAHYNYVISLDTKIAGDYNVESLRDIAVDHQGKIYTSERSYARLQVFEPLTTYRFSINPEEGDVTVTIREGAVYDAAGNTNLNPDSTSFNYVVPPVARIILPDNRAINGNVSLTVQFSEEIKEFDLNDLQITNGSVVHMATTDSIDFQLELQPEAEGVVKVSVLNNTVVDLQGLTNETVVTDSLYYDISSPTVVIGSPMGNITNLSSIPVTFTFSEAVYNFEQSNITIQNGMLDRFATNDSITFSARLFPVTNSLVTIDIPEAITTDAAGNSNEAAIQLKIQHDRVYPTVNIVSSIPPITNTLDSLIEIIFSEKVKGFHIDDVFVYNGTIVDLQTTDSTVFYASLLPDKEGYINVNIYARYVKDVAGNYNSRSNTFSVYYDAVRPTATLTSNAESYTNSDSIDVTVLFSEAITSFTSDDIVCTNCTVKQIFTSDSLSYQVLINPLSDGEVSLTLPDGVVEDHAGNKNQESNTFLLFYDKTRPTIAVRSTESNPTVNSSFDITIVFSELIRDFSMESITIENAVISDLATSDSITFVATISSISEGVISVSINPNIVYDLAENKNEASNLFETYHDATKPTVTFASELSQITNIADIPLNITFSEKVIDFDLNDVQISNGMVDYVSTTDSTDFTAVIVPNSDGEVSVLVPTDMVHDQAGNSNQVSGIFKILYDGTAPTVQLSNIENSLIIDSLFNLTISFSESVKSFSADSLQIQNATIAKLHTLDSISFLAEILPSTAGSIIIQVPYGVTYDQAGNLNEASEELHLLYEPETLEEDTLHNLSIKFINPDPAISSSTIVNLYQNIDNQYRLITREEVNGVDSIVFDQLTGGEYTIGIQPSDSVFLSSYLGKQLTLAEANIITFSRDTSLSFYILKEDTQTTSGDAAISGVLLKSSETGNGRIMTGTTKYSGTPLPDITTYLIHPETSDVIARSTTDREGRFTFRALPDGDFLFLADYAGIPNDEGQNLLSIVSGQKALSITVIAGNNIRVLEIQEDNQVTAIEDELREYTFQFYPNPIAEELHIDLSSFWLGGEIKVSDPSGKLLKTDKITHRTTTINMKNMGAGIYFITLLKGNDHQAFKVLKQ